MTWEALATLDSGALTDGRGGYERTIGGRQALCALIDRIACLPCQAWAWPVRQPPLDRSTVPPGPGEGVVAADEVALRVQDVEEQSDKVAVGRIERAGSFEHPTGLGEIRVDLASKALTQERVCPGVPGIERNGAPGFPARIL